MAEPEVDDTAPEGDAPTGKHAGGVLHGKHSTEILVICSVVTVVLGYLTFRGKGNAKAAAAASTSPTGVTAGDVAGFDQASVQGLSDQLATMGQAQAGAFQNFTDALTAQGTADQAAQAGLATQIANQGATLGHLQTTISALPQQIAAKIPAPIVQQAAPAPAAPSGGGGGAQYYTIRSGDTLSGIAARYPSASITAGSIARLNGIANPNRIFAGHTIRIY